MSDGEETIVLPILQKLGYDPQRAKTNIGLGRKVIRDLTNAAPIAAAKGNGERMTNTLHRYGKAESFVDDYIVFSLPAKSKAAGQTGDALAAQKRFMQIAAEYSPLQPGRRAAWRLACGPPRARASSAIGASATSRTSRRCWKA